MQTLANSKEKMPALASEMELMNAAHGGNLAEVCRATGLNTRNILDFSVNLNPLGSPSSMEDLYSQSFHRLQEYPDPDCRIFKRDLAKTLGVAEDNLVITNGSTELIYLLPKLLDPGKEVLIATPCFSEYAHVFEQENFVIHIFPLDRENDFSFNLDTFLTYIENYPNVGAIVVGHPNNPTGELLPRNSLEELCSFCERGNILLIVDEAFIDFVAPENSFLKFLSSCSNLILIRSFTKFYSIPGLRLGYGIMAPELANKIESYRPTWSVNVLSQLIGSAVLFDREFRQKTRSYVEEEKNFLASQLSKIPFLKVFSSDANFILFQLLPESNTEPDIFYLDLLHNGILLRNCGNFTGLDESFFRIAVRGREDNQQLISHIQKFFQKTEGKGLWI